MTRIYPGDFIDKTARATCASYAHEGSRKHPATLAIRHGRRWCTRCAVWLDHSIRRVEDDTASFDTGFSP